LASACSVPVEDLIVFFNVPNCAVIMWDNAVKMLKDLELDVAALNHGSEGALLLVKQSRFRQVSAETLLKRLQP
jgi:hypothetical protein